MSLPGLGCGMRALSCSMLDLVPGPGIEPRPPALGAWSRNHWTTREVPGRHFHKVLCPFFESDYLFLFCFVFFFAIEYLSSLYIGGINSLSDIWFANIFFHSTDSGPQPFRRQGPVSWKTIFPRGGRENGGWGNGSGGNASDGERWQVADEASLASLPLTSCCVAWYLTGGRPTAVCGPGVGDPAIDYLFTLLIVSFAV